MLAHGLELSSKFPVTNNYPVTKNYLVRFFVNLKRKKTGWEELKILGRAQIALIIRDIFWHLVNHLLDIDSVPLLLDSIKIIANYIALIQKCW